MRYYAVSDVHSYLTPLKKALTEKGFFEDREPHKLMVCGDLFDRGPEPKEMQDFILDLMARNQVILIRGNHEDLMLDLVDNLPTIDPDLLMRTHYAKNGTVKTLQLLTDSSDDDLLIAPDRAAIKMKETPYYRQIIPATLNFFETDRYVFTHGWIPDRRATKKYQQYAHLPNTGLEWMNFTYDWRNATALDWWCARWFEYMDALAYKLTVPGKTVVCGHRGAYYGNLRADEENGIPDPPPNYAPFRAPGCLVLDTSTYESGLVNCVVLDD